MLTFFVTEYVPHMLIIVKHLAEILQNYPNTEIKNKLIQGFAIGCSRKPENCPPPENHPPVFENIEIAREMVKEEIKLKQCLGPYKKEPLPGLICSPLNLVLKAGSKGKFRLIHNLAYPYNENSINATIPDYEAKVEYLKFNHVIKLGLQHGISMHTGKVDFDVAFRNFPTILRDLAVMGFRLDDHFYINSSMAFGARSSCKIFEEFATAIQWAIEQRTASKDTSHYLDNFIFMHKFRAICKWYMEIMQNLCRYIGTPLSDKKTEGPTQQITFLGLLIDFFRQVVKIPEDKIGKAMELITNALNTLSLTDKNSKGKVTVKELQKITGILNFLCKAVPSGRPFLRRLYDLQAKVVPASLRHLPGVKANPKFKIRLDKGATKDLVMWLRFLQTDSMSIHREVPFTQFIGCKQGPLLFANASGNP